MVNTMLTRYLGRLDFFRSKNLWQIIMMSILYTITGENLLVDTSIMHIHNFSKLQKITLCVQNRILSGALSQSLVEGWTRPVM